MTKERIGKIFYEKMSGNGVEADLSGQGKNAQKRPLSNKTSEQREDHLAAERKRAPVKRSNETTVQRKERLAAERKRAAVKRSNETTVQRKERLAAERKRAAVKRSNETTVQRKERLAAERKRAAVKRSNETTEQREERLAAQRKRAAAKVFNESSKEREERLRAKRERAAVKLTQETSQEKDIRLRVCRERAALKRQGDWSPPEGVETNRRAQSRRDSDTRRRNQREAIFAAQRNEYLHNRGWADPENHGLHHEEWAQEEMAAFHRFEENLRHYITVSFAKKHGRCLLPGSRYLLVPGASETRSRVYYILLRTTWILEASQQNYKALVKSRNCWLRERSRWCPFKHGGQRGYKGHVLSLPQDIQGFLNSLPANVSDLPILVIRKQGAGKCL